MRAPPLVMDMQSIFLKTPVEGDSILDKYFNNINPTSKHHGQNSLMNSAEAEAKLINVSPFYKQQ